MLERRVAGSSGRVTGNREETAFGSYFRVGGDSGGTLKQPTRTVLRIRIVACFGTKR